MRNTKASFVSYIKSSLNFYTLKKHEFAVQKRNCAPYSARLFVAAYGGLLLTIAVKDGAMRCPE